MSDYRPAPAGPPEWQAWPGPVATAWPAPQYVRSLINWQLEAVTALFVTAFATLFGGVVGLVWSHYAPKIYLPKAHPRIVDAVNGSEAAAKVLLGDDMSFALCGLVAGVITVAILLLVARDAGRGPGAVIGLAAGGILGSLVAAHVGHVVQQPHIISTLKTIPGITPGQVNRIVGYFDFKLRAMGAIVAWPIVAVAVHAITVIVRYFRLGPDS